MKKVLCLLSILFFFASCSSSTKRMHVSTSTRTEDENFIALLMKNEDSLDKVEVKEKRPNKQSKTKKAIAKSEPKKEEQPKKVMVSEISDKDLQEFILENTQLGATSIEGDKMRSPASINVPKKSSSILTIKRYLHVDLRPTTSSFMRSASKATPETLRHMIRMGMDINATDSAGKTALIHAVQSKRYDNIQFLLKKGADKSLSDSSGKTALDYAQEIGDGKVQDLIAR